MRTTFFAFADLKYMFIVKIDLKAFLKATIRIANVFTTIVKLLVYRYWISTIWGVLYLLLCESKFQRSWNVWFLLEMSHMLKTNTSCLYWQKLCKRWGRLTCHQSSGSTVMVIPYEERKRATWIRKPWRIQLFSFFH